MARGPVVSTGAISVFHVVDDGRRRQRVIHVVYCQFYDTKRVHQSRRTVDYCTHIVESGYTNR